MKPKNLLFTSAGDNTNFENIWLDEDRNYDVWVVYYGDNEKTFSRYSKKVDYAERRKGDKWQNFHYIYNTQYDKIQEYDRIFFLDDDIIITTDDINEMFKLSLECDLWICQPSFALGSEIGWDINTHHPKYFLRYTNFVENNSCLMTKNSIKKFMEIYDPQLISFGIDYIYMIANDVHNLQNLKRFAIIDNIQCINPPGKIKAKGKIKSRTVRSFQLQNKNISKRYWPNNDITNSKSNSREFAKLENHHKRKELFIEYCKKNNFTIFTPNVIKVVTNQTQDIAHAKSNFSSFIDIKFDKTIQFEKNENNKIAFLFLTRNNLKQPKLWYDFLSEGNGKCNIYVHSKEREKLNQQFLIDHQIPEHIHTEWGRTSLVTATNLLIKNALKDKTNKMFVLVSESCIPLYSFETIHEVLLNLSGTSNKSYLYTKITPKKEADLDEYRYSMIKMKDAVYTQLSRNGDPTKELGITWDNCMRNSQWMILNREHAEIIDQHNHESLWKNFNVADEWYHYNVLRYYDPKIVENTITSIKPTFFMYVRPNQLKGDNQVKNTISNPNAHPVEFDNLEDIKSVLKDNPSLFLRKVSENLKIDYKDLNFNLEK